jgi:hypothetical protein
VFKADAVSWNLKSYFEIPLLKSDPYVYTQNTYIQGSLEVLCTYLHRYVWKV